jgi:hypothetical protein
MGGESSEIKQEEEKGREKEEVLRMRNAECGLRIADCEKRERDDPEEKNSE